MRNHFFGEARSGCGRNGDYYGRKEEGCVPKAGAEPFQHVSGDAGGCVDFGSGADGEPGAAAQD